MLFYNIQYKNGKYLYWKLNIKAFPSKYDRMYNERRSTQVPTGRVIAIKGRVSRKIGFNGNYIKYEKAVW